MELFDKTGKLTKILKRDGHKIELLYKDNKLEVVQDNFGKKILFDWDTQNKLIAARSIKDKNKTEYKYLENNLISSKDLQGNGYQYTYDNRHKLLEVKDANDKKFSIAYDLKSERVTEYQTPEGIKSIYQFGADSSNPQNHFWITISEKNPFLDSPVIKRYEYQYLAKSDGQRQLNKEVMVFNGIKQETIYDDCCARPIQITLSGQVTKFEYNKNGLLTKKVSTNGNFDQIEYHTIPGLGHKISKVTNKDGWTKFDYNKNGELTKAENDQGRSITLHYNQQNQIDQLVDKDNQNVLVLNFKYNYDNRPIEIAVKDVGKVDIQYSLDGAVDKVHSNQGAQIAEKITKAFRSLYEIIAPAGVNLSI